MPDLHTLLRSYDLKMLSHLADLWAVPAQGADKRAVAKSLSTLLLEEALFDDFYQALPALAKEALADIKQAGGQLPWSRFARKYGDLRSMGPGKREREQPWLFPASTAELLYYRALIGREFIRKDDELLEICYIPTEFLTLLPEVPEKENLAIEKRLKAETAPAIDAQKDHAYQVVDDFCTLFAALRLGDAPRLLAKSAKPEPYWAYLKALAADLGLLGKDGKPIDLARALLERSRAESLAWLIANWANAKVFNELRLTPELRCEGSWRNDPLPTRRKVLTLLKALPVGEWFSLKDFVRVVEEIEPDFLRQGVDYDVWLIYSARTGALLRGIDSWQDVEPHFLRFFICQWMFWLGLTRVYQDEAGEVFFSMQSAIKALDGISVHEKIADEEEALIAHPNGHITMSDKTAPIARYQIARFAEWLELGPEAYSYQITPASLTKAAKVGLSTHHLISLLRKYGKSAPPPNLVKALSRWQEHGTEAQMETLTVLRLTSPDILQALKQSEAKAWLGDSLGPVAVVIKAGGLEKVQKTLARLGYLSDFDVES